MLKYSALECFGLVAIAGFLTVILAEAWKLLYTCFLGHALGHSLSFKDIGRWAVVTGATDGIGRAYAEELAAKGINIVLISRSRTKLQNVASEIETKYGVATHIIDVDFTLGGEIYDRIAKELKGLDIGVLVNNVGMSYQYPEYLAQISNGPDFAQLLINCNVLSVTRMSLLVLGQMVERRKGLILNISSASAFLPTPLMTMYSSTKAFVYKFSEDLGTECAPFGITVQCVLPAFVATNMSRIKRPSLKAPSPKDFVRSQMKSLGLETYSAGYWFHKLLWCYYSKLLVIWPSAVLGTTTSTLYGLRQRALKRIQQQQQQQNVEVVRNASMDPYTRIARVEGDFFPQYTLPRLVLG